MPAHDSPAVAATTSADSSLPGVRAARLDNYQLFAAHGDDVINFLHGQLTNDVKTLGDDQARLAGYCTPKGRLLATLVYWRAHVSVGAGAEPPSPLDGKPAVFGFMRQSVAEAVVKRLRMFVMRAKVTFDVPDGTLHGVWCTPDHLRSLCGAAGADLPQQPWHKVDLPSGTWICAPHDAGTLRWWWLRPIDSNGVPAKTVHALDGLIQPASPQTWHHGELAQGLPWIEDATQDLFIPQTVNLDLIQGVNFTKGCYPGQEIVARSHYLGKVKRRMALAAIDGEARVAPATDVFAAHAEGEPAGRVVDAAFDGTTTHVLLETTLNAMSEPALHLGAPDGPALVFKPLPYPLA